jgi:hypothetical protein
LTQVESAYQQLTTNNLAPRGFAFWNILDEGKASPQQPDVPVWLAKGLNQFLDVHHSNK